MTNRNIAIAIGVSDYARPLSYLGGAINGARAFHAWASALGYEAKLVIDDKDPVTIKRLAGELKSILTPGDGPIHRLVLYFAGHGLIDGPEQGLWLLSDWYETQSAVATERLRRRLYRYGVQQIAIFADSCRSLPPDIDAADLTPDGVLGRGPNKREEPSIDKFIAAQDGTATFIVPSESENPERDRCLFSGVLMEALWGTKPDAFSTVVSKRITSRSLAQYLKSEVPKVAGRYKWEVVPQVSPTFPEGDDIYFPEGAPPDPPEFENWPDPAFVAKIQSARQSPKPRLRVFDAVASVVDHMVAYYRTYKNIPAPPGDTQRKSKGSPRSLLKKIQSQKRPKTLETRAGFTVGGGLVRGFWTPEHVFAERFGHRDWWQIGETHQHTLQKPAPVLIEFDDGMFAAVTALPGFIATVLRVGRGISALVYHDLDGEGKAAEAAEKALAEMDRHGLRADAVTDLAISLRKGKHADPMLGVLSAYLYDAGGDIDNIRRMAFYYAEHFQPIPYDIALLAGLQSEWRDGRLWANVPAVRERKPRTDAERLNKWTHSKTPEASGEVGGLWPWIRQGWAFLDDVDHSLADLPALQVQGLIELTHHLVPTSIATFDPEGGVKLAKLFNLSNQKPPAPADEAPRSARALSAS